MIPLMNKGGDMSVFEEYFYMSIAQPPLEAEAPLKIKAFNFPGGGLSPIAPSPENALAYYH